MSSNIPSNYETMDVQLFRNIVNISSPFGCSPDDESSLAMVNAEASHSESESETICSICASVANSLNCLSLGKQTKKRKRHNPHLDCPDSSLVNTSVPQISDGENKRRRKHPQEFHCIKQKCEGSQQEVDDSGKFPRDHPKQKAFDKSMMGFVATSSVPLETFKCEHFRRVWESLEPRLRLFEDYLMEQLHSIRNQQDRKKPFECFECGYRGAKEVNLKRHIRRMHF